MLLIKNTLPYRNFGVGMTYTELTRLPFRKFYAIDFEYFDRRNSNVVCMVVQDLRSGEVRRHWQDDLQKMKTPPFETGEDIALVCYFAPAGAKHACSGWDLNVSVIDLSRNSLSNEW